MQHAIEHYANAHGIDISSAPISLFVPGRIEILGKHTDYAGGSSITAALSRGLQFVALPRSDKIVELHAVDFQDRAIIDVEKPAEFSAGHWAAYPNQVVRRIFDNFKTASTGATILVSSSLPIASGMSSSSAFVVGTFLCLAEINNLVTDPAYVASISNNLDLADYLSTVENGGDYKSLRGHTGVGTLGGSEDHTAILASRNQHLGYYSYRPTRLIKHIEWPDSLAFVIVASGVQAQKSGSARVDYNRASSHAQLIVDVWNKHTGEAVGHLGDLVRDSNFDKNKVINVLAKSNMPELQDRFEHFYLEESELIPGMISPLERLDIAAVSNLIFKSFDAADSLLGNQIEETRSLVNIARELGAKGASAFGAGFGGSVYAIVPTEDSESFAASWLAEYQRVFPQHAQHAIAFSDRPGKAVEY